MSVKFLKISILLLLAAGLTACDIFKSKDLICKSKVGSPVRNEYEFVKIKNWEKEFCFQYLDGKFTCIPFNKTKTVFDFEDEKWHPPTQYIKRATTIKSTVNDQSYAIEVSEQLTPQVEVKYSKEDGMSVFKFKNAIRKVPRVDLTENDILTYKILTIHDSKHNNFKNFFEGSGIYKLYFDSVLGKTVVWNYSLDRNTKELSIKSWFNVYVLNCTEQTSKL